jgi:hypothetical protein
MQRGAVRGFPDQIDARTDLTLVGELLNGVEAQAEIEGYL